jgi:uncharacterized membrane protein YeiB
VREAAGHQLIALGLWRSVATKWAPLDYVLVSQELRYWGNFLVALGLVALVMLLCQRGWRLGPVAAEGRMALTNYLLQTGPVEWVLRWLIYRRRPSFLRSPPAVAEV